MPTHWILSRALRIATAAAVLLISSLAPAQAQTTLVLSAPGTQVTDTVAIRAASPNTNFGALDTMSTRAADIRALLKFDTHNTIPVGSNVQSATMTLTLKFAGTDATRPLGVFPVTASFRQNEATWNQRKTSTPWTAAGGDLGSMLTQRSVPNVAGTKVKFDVTAVVRAAVSGATTSRYTRIALVDLGVASAGAVRGFYSNKAVDPAVRPVLTVVYGTATQPAPSSRTLRVLQYNTHHGGWGTDGVYDPNRIVNWIVKANPDLVSLQEIEINTSWSKGADQTALYQSLLQQKTGVTWYKRWYSRYGSGATTGLGELILSRYPFIAVSGYALPYSRSALDVLISVNGRNVNFTSVHLDNVSQSNRLAEIGQLLPWQTTLAENRVVVGDYNAWPNTTEIAKMDATYVDTWTAAQTLGTAVGNGITHGSHRIDYIFQSKGATGLKLMSHQIFHTADPMTGVMPSDHEPVLAVFQVQ
jgi:endonuclease/exonuclease/phosphatase family metal-dependent hydrolase